MNLSLKPSDAHHAAEGKLVHESGCSRIKRIFFSSAGVNSSTVRALNPKRRKEDRV